MTPEPLRNPVFFDLDPDAETLCWSDEVSAVEMHLDDLPMPWPRKARIYGFAPVPFEVPADAVAGRIAEDLDNWLCDNYGNPEQETLLPDAIKDAIGALARTVVQHWPVWRCERVWEQEVDLVAFVRENTLFHAVDIEWMSEESEMEPTDG